MIWHCLAIMRPLDPATGQRIDVRVASASLRSITGKGGVKWVPAMIEPPRTSMTLFNGSFGSTVEPGNARLPLALTRLRRHHPGIDEVYWPGAPVTIYVGRENDPWQWQEHFVGRVATHGRSKDALELSCEVDQEPFRVDMLTVTYAGTGGAEGTPDIKGRVKPLVIGRAQNMELVLVDPVNSIYQASAYGPIEGFERLYERASAFGPPVADYATFEALLAASIPRGGWATCLARGMLRLGAPAAGVITADVRGFKVGATTPNRTGAAILALAQLAGVSFDLIAEETFVAMDLAAPYPPEIVLDQQTTLLDVARRMALPCNHQAGVSLTGQLFVTGFQISDQQDLVLHAQGRARPQVVESKELAVSPPYGRTILGAARSWRVHTADEIAFDAALIPMGPYRADWFYRRGNYVIMPDQSEWLYINDEPSSGHAPPTWPTTSNAWWENMKPPGGGGTYADGTPIDDLKPAEPGADKTSNNTSKDTQAVGGRLAEEVNRLVDLNGMNILGEILRGDALAALVDARTKLEGKDVGVVIGEVKAASEEANNVFAQNFGFLGARNGDDTGWIMNADSIEITGTGFSSRKLSALTADVDGHNADITNLQEILFHPDGTTLRSLNILDLDGRITGTVNTLTGETSDYAIYTDTFRIVSPNGGQPITPFQVADDGTVEMISVRVKTLAYEALVPLLGGEYNKLDPNNGYQILPGGTIRQWGRYRGTITRETSFSIVFPIPFPNRCVTRFAQPYIASPSHLRDLWIQNLAEPSVSGASFYTQAATSDDHYLDGFDWQAEGY